MPGALLGPFGRYELGAETVTIGRSSANKLVINDGLVSGRHLQVVPQGAEYLLVDVGSSNGTKLNGQRLTPQTPQPLLNGDIIVIGNTTLTVELAPAAFPAAPGLAAQGEIVIAPPQQPGVFPPATNNSAFPPYAPPGPAAPNYGGPAPQGAPFAPAAPGSSPFPSAAPAQPGWPFPPSAPTPQDVPFPSAAPAEGPFPSAGPGPQGWPFPPTQQAPNQFGPSPGQPPAYQPGFGAPLGAPLYGGAPGAGGFPPPRTRAKRNRMLLLIGGVVALILILGIGAIIFLRFTGNRFTTQGTPTPAATQQVIMPFYEDLKKQDYKAATSLLTSDYLQQLGGVQEAIKVFQTIDTNRGQLQSYTVASVKPVNGSSTTQMALVNVTRDPQKGKFLPDTLQIVLEQGKWQISLWMPGMRQS